MDLFSSKYCTMIDCKTVVFFANVGDSQYLNERPGANVKTVRENGE